MKYIKCKFSVVEDFSVPTFINGFHIESRFSTLHKDGTLDVKAGWAWDGASGAIDTKNILIPSCIHDIFCWLINTGKLPAYLQSLVDAYTHFFHRYNDAPLLVVNAAEINPVDNSADFDMLLKHINSAHHGRQFLNPLASS